MSSYSGRKFIPRTLALLLGLIAIIALLPAPGIPQSAGKKLTKQDVLDLLNNNVSSDDVAQSARKAGISFQVTPSVEREIRAANGSDALINVLKSLGPRPPVQPPYNPPPATGPPVLMIQSTPGQTQVYVDDEPVGSTSPEGRLKLTRFAAGTHTVRISLNGYQDFEQRISLSAGSSTTVEASLQVKEIAPPPQQPVVQPPPEQPAIQQPPANNGQVGYLGVHPQNPQPVGARGVVIAATEPGGPAARAGIKANDSILAVNGSPVSSTEALLSALSSHQPGEVVKVTIFNGARTFNREVRLAVKPTQSEVQPQVQPEPQQPVAPPVEPQAQVQLTAPVTFLVAHDHMQNGQNYCAGVMTIGNGMIIYKGVKGNGPIHSFEIPLNSVKEYRRNPVYLRLIGAFHIRLTKGTNYNFVVLNQQGQFQPPDALLSTLDAAMGR